MFLLWFWFFGRDKSDILPNNGGFNTATDANGNANGSGTDGNGTAPIGSNTGTGSNGSSDTGGNGQTTIPDYTYTPSYVATSSYTTSPVGVVWLDGGTSGTGGAGGQTNRNFTPTPINQLNGVDVSGIGNIGSGGGTGGLGSGGTIIGAGIAGVVSCAGFLVNPAGLATPLSVFSVQVNAPAQNSNEIMDCLTRVIAKVALQQITTSIVDWINSGFDGQPAFVQDYEQFFSDIADKAAGEFIEGSGLAFLCSPFKLQIKIAIAQSYANRKSSSASSCTLTQVVGNIENFMKGDFSAGGWAGLISFTTTPSNNPYGAYMQAEASLGSFVAAKVSAGASNISPEGYLGVTQEYDCKTSKDTDGSVKKDCKTRIVTPGANIAASTQKVLNLPIDENLLADSFDEIISALINQLMTKVIYGGLANLSKNISGDSAQQRGIDAAQTLLTNLQGSVQLAQQYGTAQQGAVSDLQTAQAQLNTLSNCWNTAASSTSITSGQVAQAQGNAASADSTIASLETRVAVYNAKITKANTAVAAIQQLQSNALTATTLKEVQAVQAQYTAAQNAGTLVTQTDVTSAQQDRQTLQSEMTGLNQTTSSSLTQCYAFGH
jgi:hypothetical protein